MNIITSNFTDEFMAPRNRNYPLWQSWEIGGVALNDVSKGLNSHVWKSWTDTEAVYLQRDGSETTHTLLTDTDIQQIDVSFDQNMNPCVAYVAKGVAKLYYYDAALTTYHTLTFDNMRYPRLSLDDKRAFNISNSNLILAYMNDKRLCIRLQNERFGIEHELFVFDSPKVLWRIGMGQKRRFLFYMR